MFVKKHKFRKVLAAVLLFCLVCSCFLTFGRTSAYITDSSNTCLNTFTGEEVTEPSTEPTTEPDTQPQEPTTQPADESTTAKPETTTAYVDSSPVSPATGAPDTQLVIGILCTLVIGIAFALTGKVKFKNR